jgi:hypothetical protein
MRRSTPHPSLACRNPAATQARFLELHATGGLADADETAQAMLDYLMADDFGAHELDDLREARARND